MQHNRHEDLGEHHFAVLILNGLGACKGVAKVAKCRLWSLLVLKTVKTLTRQSAVRRAGNLTLRQRELHRSAHHLARGIVVVFSPYHRDHCRKRCRASFEPRVQPVAPR